MCTCSTAKRRRKQARGKYRHLPPLRRPKYTARSAEKAANHLQRVIMAERLRQSRKSHK